MKIRSDKEINGVTAKWLRSREKMSQSKFWAMVGVSQSCGSQYEHGSRKIPAPVQKQLFMVYEAGIRFDTSTTQGADALREFAQQRASS